MQLTSCPWFGGAGKASPAVDGKPMTGKIHPLLELLQRDDRFKLEAYQFVRESLDYAQGVLGMGHGKSVGRGKQEAAESHLTGQELCHAIRQYALEQYGYMAKWVLGSWGIHSTSDFGEIVYNLISISLMKKSETDRREDFDDVYDFDAAFVQQFKIEPRK
jgi:uncharacterized repeat protein (TIGR04138 family)